MTTQEPTFADALEQLRISHGLTPAKLARELDEYEGNVSRWRRGGGIEVAKVRKIADYFHVSRGWLEGLAGYPESRDDSSVAVDPDKLERITLVEQVSPEDWPSVRKMLLGLAAAANTSNEPTVNLPGSGINTRRGRQQPPIKSQNRRFAGVLVAFCSPFLRRPAPVQFAATG